ncbi:hypothetical protein BDZ94DRAFT_1313811 [Collybia nuda]|uniref:Uncharacterized protein n=1 Tax=Collybia nuda TaxID=64659 RepID=A0A9P6CD82_9AGAR|nr:hypothetical protein BDZ94DRAFT_1313811 [Collybia nuda]
MAQDVALGIPACDASTTSVSTKRGMLRFRTLRRQHSISDNPPLPSASTQARTSPLIQARSSLPTLLANVQFQESLNLTPQLSEPARPHVPMEIEAPITSPPPHSDPSVQFSATLRSQSSDGALFLARHKRQKRGLDIVKYGIKRKFPACPQRVKSPLPGPINTSARNRMDNNSNNVPDPGISVSSPNISGLTPAIIYAENEKQRPGVAQGPSSFAKILCKPDLSRRMSNLTKSGVSDKITPRSLSLPSSPPQNDNYRPQSTEPLLEIPISVGALPLASAQRENGSPWASENPRNSRVSIRPGSSTPFSPPSRSQHDQRSHLNDQKSLNNEDGQERSSRISPAAPLLSDSQSNVADYFDQIDYMREASIPPTNLYGSPDISHASDGDSDDSQSSVLIEEKYQQQDSPFEDPDGVSDGSSQGSYEVDYCCGLSPLYSEATPLHPTRNNNDNDNVQDANEPSIQCCQEDNLTILLAPDLDNVVMDDLSSDEDQYMTSLPSPPFSELDEPFFFRRPTYEEDEDDTEIHSHSSASPVVINGSSLKRKRRSCSVNSGYNSNPDKETLIQKSSWPVDHSHSPSAGEPVSTPQWDTESSISRETDDKGSDSRHTLRDAVPVENETNTDAHPVGRRDSVYPESEKSSEGSSGESDYVSDTTGPDEYAKEENMDVDHIMDSEESVAEEIFGESSEEDYPIDPVATQSEMNDGFSSTHSSPRTQPGDYHPYTFDSDLDEKGPEITTPRKDCLPSGSSRHSSCNYEIAPTNTKEQNENLHIEGGETDCRDLQESALTHGLLIPTPSPIIDSHDHCSPNSAIDLHGSKGHKTTSVSPYPLYSSTSPSIGSGSEEPASEQGNHCRLSLNVEVGSAPGKVEEAAVNPGSITAAAAEAGNRQPTDDMKIKTEPATLPIDIPSDLTLRRRRTPRTGRYREWTTSSVYSDDIILHREPYHPSTPPFTTKYREPSSEDQFYQLDGQEHNLSHTNSLSGEIIVKEEDCATETDLYARSPSGQINTPGNSSSPSRTAPNRPDKEDTKEEDHIRSSYYSEDSVHSLASSGSGQSLCIIKPNPALTRGEYGRERQPTDETLGLRDDVDNVPVHRATISRSPLIRNLTIPPNEQLAKSRPSIQPGATGHDEYWGGSNIPLSPVIPPGSPMEVDAITDETDSAIRNAANLLHFLSTNRLDLRDDRNALRDRVAELNTKLQEEKSNRLAAEKHAAALNLEGEQKDRELLELVNKLNETRRFLEEQKDREAQLSESVRNLTAQRDEGTL